MPSHEHPAATERDPFADDVLERLIRSNQDYQRSHGHYIVPLAERLLVARTLIEDTLHSLRHEPELSREQMARYDADDPCEDDFRARWEAVSDEGEDAP
jgi:hypothetical protein